MFDTVRISTPITYSIDEMGKGNCDEVETFFPNLTLFYIKTLLVVSINYNIKRLMFTVGLQICLFNHYTILQNINLIENFNVSAGRPVICVH